MKLSFIHKLYSGSLRFFLFLLVFSFFSFLFVSPASANHFRAGTLSWETVPGKERTILLKGQIGWTNNHVHIPMATPIGGVVTNKVLIDYGDGTSVNAAVRVISRNTTTNDVQTELVSIKTGDSDYTEGLEKTYASDGTYTAGWGSSARETAINLDGSSWRNETKVNIGGTYAGNNSPSSAVAAVVQVPDNTIFTYKLAAVDKDGDNIKFRYGTKPEFFSTGTGEATKPTGLAIDEEGNITWDVTDETLSTNIGDRWQMTVMVEDLDNEGQVKSYVPLDFVLRISDSSDAPPVITTEQSSYSVGSGNTLVFQLTAKDTDWEEGFNSPQISVINPPSASNSIWSTTSSSEDDTSVMEITFSPTAGMQGNQYVIVFQAIDNGGNASTKNITFNINTVTPIPTATSTPTPTQVVTSTPQPTPATCTTQKAVAPELFQIDTQQNKATVYFSPISGFNTYTVSYSTNSDGEGTTVSHSGDSVGVQKVTIDSLDSNSTYYFKVRVDNGCMPGEWSSIKSISTIQSQIVTPLLPQEKMRITNVSVQTPLKSQCTYTVEPGDTLWKLSEEAFGDGFQTQKIIDLNKNEYPNIATTLEVGSVLSFPCESFNEDLPHTHDGEGNSIKTYKNVLTIYVENNGVPLANANVELHSNPKYGKTDQNGKVTFTDVEPGEHTLYLVHNGYKSEQKVTLDDGQEEYSIKINVEMKQSPWYFSIISLVAGALLTLFIIWLFFFIKKRKKKEEDKQS